MNSMASDDMHDLTSNGSDISVQLLADHGQHDHAGNSSDVGDNDDSFFRIYFSSTRFTAETVIAMTSAGINAAVLTTLVIALPAVVIMVTVVVASCDGSGVEWSARLRQRQFATGHAGPWKSLLDARSPQ